MVEFSTPVAVLSTEKRQQQKLAEPLPLCLLESSHGHYFLKLRSWLSNKWAPSRNHSSEACHIFLCCVAGTLMRSQIITYTWPNEKADTANNTVLTL